MVLMILSIDIKILCQYLAGTTAASVPVIGSYGRCGRPMSYKRHDTIIVVSRRAFVTAKVHKKGQ